MTSAPPPVSLLVTPRTQPALRNVARAIVPEAEGLDTSGWTSFETLLERAVAARPPQVARQLRGFLRLLGAVAWIQFGRGFGSLSVTQTTALLDRLAASRVLLLRRGVWGLRTLVFYGYYGDANRAAAIGYRASPRGWAARR